MWPTSHLRTPFPARARRGASRTVALTLAVVLALTGCSSSDEADDDQAAADREAAEAATASPSPAPSGPPEREVPSLPTGADALEDDRAGRAAFAEHVVETWAYAIATNDPDPLLDLSARDQPCGGCRPFARELRQRAEQGWFVALDRVFVTDTDAPRRAAPRSPVTVAVTLDIPATYALNDDRSYRSANPSHDGATFEVEMAWRRGGFVLLAYSLTT